MFSRRTGWDPRPNAIAERLEALRREGRPLLDLTESNPTRCGLSWDPDALAAVLADPRSARYEPTPQGSPEARAAVAEYLAARGVPVTPERIVLTASTSEAYALLWKLLCDPGDEVLAAIPTYPLLDLLAGLESVALAHYPLRYDGEWHIDFPALEAALTARTRAVVVVNPSNPTGALLSPAELDRLEELCAGWGIALVGDEVFADAALGPSASVARSSRCLAFHLSGLSKVCGLPQLKAGWIATAGPAPLVAEALRRLDIVADTYLSVSGPAQLALSRLLPARERFLGPLRQRLGVNRAALGRAASGDAPFTLLRSGGGWSAVLRVAQTWDEEALALALLDDGVVVQPGYFYDFPGAGHVVVSLLPDPILFEEGVRRVAARLRGGPSRAPIS